MNYIDNVNQRTKEYFEVLEPDFPTWLNDYINTKELLKQQYISVTCGTIYSNLFCNNYFFSSLDHSIAVALICWHFTHDKKITLSGLFHDIATPAFKHCIDFLNKDYMKQESTEDLTTEVIKGSKEIMSLLKRDGIKLEEINDYHIYPIADNDTPKLSSDRLEYSLSNALFTHNILNLESIKKIYEDIEVQKNEEGIEELGFKTDKLAREFVEFTSKLSIIYRQYKTIYSMQLLADIIKELNNKGIIEIKDLYDKKECEIIEIIKNSEYKEIYDIWQKATEVKISKEKPSDVYYVKLSTKIRYINPLVNGLRASEVDEESNKLIKENLQYDTKDYVYLNLKF